ncbi:CRISPR-associated endonuclease Cas2 [Clostridium autoethanogenum]|uniref:CRISPR-associated endoribonuclease Cas2 n=2 Tax=Clostridium autoethanogenum TaxID=84023 RepID=A0A3M0T2K8_9CLOT|nr:CRISPR-associated endonuclease Cas2 [Clostridium autoethanogenum]AGY75619.1 CRISPR-associated endonuclease Cas2 [Clostridium autoethanogenum DSM 10061]ALU35782.1 CRISPR-associated protein Cas2 [Clostridium autoethanogenum DSM 10061]OVY52156.1 CRISPR-associated endoribonuclease Cas2 [Clostridium autoethanogenum]RMD04162.1 CRISPR-associated endonuclease Cas2 [Clostridium autoethanogenum]
MGKNFNFNYAFVFYDVNEKRVNKVFKVCKKYFHHHQNSVFRGAITTSKMIKLKSELNKIIKDKDFVTIIKLMNDSCFEEDTLGINENNTEDLIL